MNEMNAAALTYRYVGFGAVHYTAIMIYIYNNEKNTFYTLAEIAVETQRDLI